MSLTKVSFSMISGAPANVDDYGAKGDGTTDDTAAIQSAVDQNVQIRFTPGKTYVVSPQNLTTPEGGTGICINVSSNKQLILTGATIIQKNGTGGTGAIIGNTIAVTNVSITGGIVNGNSSNTTGNMTTVVLWNATNCIFDGISTTSNRFIGLGFRATTSGYGRNTIQNCYVQGSLFIGIQCNRPSLGLAIINNTIENIIDNAIDVEGNNASGDPSIGNRILIDNNRCYSVSIGIFLESLGDSIVSDNIIQNFSSAGIQLNRINSGSYRTIIDSNQILDGSGKNGIYINNNSGKVIISNNYFKTLDASISCNGTAQYVSVCNNLHENVVSVLVKVTQGVNQLIRSHILTQDYIGTKVFGKPFSISPLTNSTNYPNRTFDVLAQPAFYMDGALQASTLVAEYQDGITGTLDANGAWGGAYSIYSGGETLVYENSTGFTVGRYATINGVLFLIYSSVSSGVWAVRSAAGAAGDYTATTNGAYAWVEYYPEWQTT